MTKSPFVVVKRAWKLSGAWVANAGLAGSWKSGLTAAASLPASARHEQGDHDHMEIW
jgi:hypothetical protein